MIFNIPGMAAPKLTGNATAADVLSGKTFYSTDPKVKLTGTYVPTKTASLAQSNPTAGTYYSNVIDCGSAGKVCNYVIYAGGGDNQYTATTYIQGSNDKSNWYNAVTFNSSVWGNTNSKSGVTTPTYRYWRICVVITAAPTYCGQMATIWG